MTLAPPAMARPISAMRLSPERQAAGRPVDGDLARTRGASARWPRPARPAPARGAGSRRSAQGGGQGLLPRSRAMIPSSTFCPDGEVLDQLRHLEGAAQAGGGDLAHGGAGGGRAVDRHRCRRRWGGSRVDDVQQRRLAAAVGADRGRRPRLRRWPGRCRSARRWRRRPCCRPAISRPTAPAVSLVEGKVAQSGGRRRRRPTGARRRRRRRAPWRRTSCSRRHQLAAEYHGRGQHADAEDAAGSTRERPDRQADAPGTGRRRRSAPHSVPMPPMNTPPSRSRIMSKPNCSGR